MHLFILHEETNFSVHQSDSFYHTEMKGQVECVALWEAVRVMVAQM